MVIERLGKYHGIAEGGYFWSIPLVDEIRFVIDMRKGDRNCAAGVYHEG
jgi:regulator of protease activity HflC (stomatin/prohibitin superfamily)